MTEAVIDTVGRTGQPVADGRIPGLASVEVAGGGKRVFVKTYGCQMNVYDSERMSEALAAAGYSAAAGPDDADVVVLNTCHIRERAAEKVYSEVGRLKRLKAVARAAGREMKVAVAGCVAQAEGAEILARAPAVDLVVGPGSYHRLPELLGETGRPVAVDFAGAAKFDRLAPRRGGLSPTGVRRVSAFLTVQEGCDKFCAFCVVPYTRGAELSRPVAALLAEAERLAGSGVREITLLGQNVNAYRGAGPDGRPWSLADLIARLADVPGVLRIRYTTSHPRDMADDLVAAHRDIGKLMPYLHLPVQSGSDRILKAMNRRHDAAEYLALVARLRASRPDLALSGDFIVGFPGETADDFEATLAVAREARYAAAFTFKYSPRPGTPAAERADPVPEPVKDERLARLQALIADAQAAFNAATLGRRLDVLVEKPGRRPGQLVGKSPWLQSVHIDAPAHRIGSVVAVDIVGLGTNTLSGRLAGAAEPGRSAA